MGHTQMTTFTQPMLIQGPLARYPVNHKAAKDTHVITHTFNFWSVPSLASPKSRAGDECSMLTIYQGSEPVDPGKGEINKA